MWRKTKAVKPSCASRLPFELWQRIASYIPESTLPKLCGVNRPLFEIGMNAIYNDFRVVSLHESFIARLHGAKDPSIAGRVQSLEVDLTAFTALTANSSRSVRPDSYLHHLRNRLSSHTKTRESVSAWGGFHAFLASVQAMNNLQRVRIRFLSWDDSNIYATFLQELWPLLSQCIHSLTLVIPAQSAPFLANALASPPPAQLAHFSLSVSIITRQIDQAVTSGLADVLNKMSPTLRSLDLNLNFHGEVVEYHDMIRRLAPIPKLRCLSLSIPICDTNGTVVFEFVNKHSETLEQLVLQPMYAMESHATPLATFHLPLLTSLDISVHFSQRQFHDLWSETLHFESLTRLKIDRPTLFHDSVVPICEAFIRSGTGSSLREVELDVRVLDGEVFDYLALAFPSLHTLSVLAKYLCTYDLKDPWQFDGLATQMACRRYAEWELYDLTITLMEVTRNTEQAVPSYRAMRIAATSIPSVHSFCGRGHVDDQLPEKTGLDASTWKSVSTVRSRT